jgi:hypothetical protein
MLDLQRLVVAGNAELGIHLADTGDELIGQIGIRIRGITDTAVPRQGRQPRGTTRLGIIQHMRHDNGVGQPSITTPAASYRETLRPARIRGSPNS